MGGGFSFMVVSATGGVLRCKFVFRCVRSIRCLIGDYFGECGCIHRHVLQGIDHCSHSALPCLGEISNLMHVKDWLM